MTEKEYNGIYERLSDDSLRGSYFYPMMNMVHVVTIDESSRKIISMLSKDCELLTPVEKQYCSIVQKCTSEKPSMSYAEALLLLGDSYKENIQSYMDYGMFVSPGLYPVRYYELQALAWTGELESDIVCICRDEHNISEYNYVHVCKSGYVKRTDMDGHKLFDPDNDFYICFLIDLEFAEFVREIMKKQELKNTTNELKTLTRYYHTPIITAQHLPKNSSMKIDSYIQTQNSSINTI